MVNENTVENTAQYSHVAPEDFVEKILQKRGASDTTILLAGYVGKSPVEGNIILYLDPNLSNGLEIRQEDVVHYEKKDGHGPLSQSYSLLPVTLLWLRKSANYKPVRPGEPSENATPQILDGAIINDYKNQTMQQQPQAPGAYASIFGICPTQIAPICAAPQQSGPAQATAAWTSFLGICPTQISPICAVPQQVGQVPQAQASAAWTSFLGLCPTQISPICAAPQQVGQGFGQAPNQAQTTAAWTSILGICPTQISPICAAPQQAGQSFAQAPNQAQTTGNWPTVCYCPTQIPPICPGQQQATGQPQATAAWTSFLGFCPTHIPFVC